MAPTAGRRQQKKSRVADVLLEAMQDRRQRDKSFTTEEEIMSVQNVSPNDTSFKIKINRDRRAPLTQGTGNISEEGEMLGHDRTALFTQPQQLLLLPVQD